MTIKQLESIWESVEVYLDHYEKRDLSRAYYGTNTCPCCIAYPIDVCSGCPVRAYTGKALCWDTPYYAMWDILYHPYLTDEEKLLYIEEEYRFLVDVALKVSEEYLNG